MPIFSGMARLRGMQLQGERVGQEQERARQKEELAAQQAADDRKRKIESDALQRALLEKQVNAPPEQRNIDPLSTEGIGARLEYARGEAAIPQPPGQRNIDPLSETGIAAQLRLAREKPSATDQSKPTEGMRRAQMLHSVATEAQSVLEKATAPGYFESIAKRAGANELLGEERQIIDQAARQFTSSYLYLVSGATASPQEVDNLAKQLVPQRGDTPAVLARKAQAVRTMAKAMGSYAGGEPMGAGGTGAAPAPAADPMQEIEAAYQEDIASGMDPGRAMALKTQLIARLKGMSGASGHR